MEKSAARMVTTCASRTPDLSSRRRRVKLIRLPTYFRTISHKYPPVFETPWLLSGFDIAA